LTQTTITLRLPKLHAAQQVIKRDALRFNVLDCGRRFGKDILLTDLAVEPALRGFPVGWFEPSFPMMVEVWPKFVETLAPVTAHKDASEHRIQLISGGIIKLWSLSNDDAVNSARGKKYKRVIINEAGYVSALLDKWGKVIRPTLTDYAGDAFIGGTPNGRNDFWRMFEWGQGNDPEWRSWKRPSSDNPHLPAGEIEAARRTLPERTFAQEYEAEFIEDGGAVFRRVRSCADPTLPCEPYEGAFIMGLDWGREHDFTVATVMDMATRRVVAIDRFNKIDWAYQRERVKALFARWGCQTIVAEHNSIGGPNIEALVADDIPVFPFVTTNPSKAVLIERLVLAIENRTISYPADAALIGELEAFEMARTKLGTATYGAPEGSHDDMVMSLALANWGCN
jgi:hypothetical protein